nr:hypothetical protein [Psychrobacter sp. PraFG1]UNK05468.1 hypothetical protein MN210_00490 [Psychrobacter sp. PraFG1]
MTLPIKLRILKSSVTNPWFNLATEDWIFQELDAHSHTLFLWRNSETVVIGRSQNPWVECKTDKMAEDGVYLARRQSGAGLSSMIWAIPTSLFYHPKTAMISRPTLTS